MRRPAIRTILGLRSHRVVVERIIRWLVQFQMRDAARLERADAVKKAIESIECEGLSLREASAQAGCATTLFKQNKDRVHHTSVGRPTTLSEVEEKIIARCNTTLGSFGHPPTRDMVGSVIQNYFQHSGRPYPFCSGYPRKKWWRNFFQRWPDLRQRTPEHLTL